MPRKIKNNNKDNFSLRKIKPITTTQKRTFKEYEQENNLLLHGIAGTGKTFISLYLALRDVFNYNTHNKVIIMRSIVPSRDIGFLPGSLKEKIKNYELPYRDIINDLFKRDDAYDIMSCKGYVEFMSTSFVRGITLDNAIIVVDESQNMTYQELNSIITRVGENSKIVFCGDSDQSDLRFADERNGFTYIKAILDRMPSFRRLEFNEDDIVRSDLVKEYIVAKLNYERESEDNDSEHKFFKAGFRNRGAKAI